MRAVGKDALLLKRKDAVLSADFGGAHYYEYALDNLSEGRSKLQDALLHWSAEYGAFSIKALYGK